MNSQNYQLYAPLRIKQQVLRLLKKAGFDSSLRGVVMALKPVQAEQVRRPSESRMDCATLWVCFAYMPKP